MKKLLSLVHMQHVSRRSDTDPVKNTSPQSSQVKKQHSTYMSSENDIDIASKESGKDLEMADAGLRTFDSLRGMPESTAAAENQVWWDSADDPHNPYNWPSAKKWGHVCIVSTITFITPLASSILAPAVPQVMEEFKCASDLLGAWVVSVYVLGFAMGPLIWAPLSETQGRLPIYHLCNMLFLAFTLACALSTSLNMLIVFRFLAGCAGSAALTLGGGTIADIIPLEKRGAAVGLFAMGPVLGPIVGAIAGGFLTEARGWRWVFWFLMILAGFITICSLIFMRETYAVAVLNAKTRRLRKANGNLDLVSRLDTGYSTEQLLLHAITRPTRILFRSPIVLSISIYVAIIYGYVYLLFTTFSTLFQGQYGMNVGVLGLTYVGIGIGSIIGLGWFSYSSDRIMREKSGSGEMKPEYRLSPMMHGSIFVPIGLFWYGWSAQAHTHWIVPILGTVPFGFGFILILIPAQTYLVDSFTIYAASAIAASTVLRSLLGALIPLAGAPMYDKLGFGWGNSLLGFISIAMIPIPFIFYRYGEVIRKAYPVDM